MVYSESEVERIAVTAFELARKRRGALTSVDKANVLEVSQLWREVRPATDRRRRRSGCRGSVAREPLHAIAAVQPLRAARMRGLFCCWGMTGRHGRTRASVLCLSCASGSRAPVQVVTRVAERYSDVELSHMYVDNAAMQLIRAPKEFDVVVTSNLFGDILSDAGAMLTGSLGMLPSASISNDGPGIYEPVHGSAPDIAGQDTANPLAMILSAAMMCRYGLSEPHVAEHLERAVTRVLDAGWRTGDIMAEGCTQVGCSEMGEKLSSCIGEH